MAKKKTENSEADDSKEERSEEMSLDTDTPRESADILEGSKANEEPHSPKGVFDGDPEPHDPVGLNSEGGVTSNETGNMVDPGHKRGVNDPDQRDKTDAKE